MRAHELAGIGAAVDRLEDLHRAGTKLPGRAILHRAVQGQIDKRVGWPVAVIDAAFGAEVESPVAVDRADPCPAASDVDRELPVAADDADVELVLRGVDVRVRGGAGDRADRAVVIADDDRVVQLDRRAERRGGECEDLAAAQAGQP